MSKIINIGDVRTARDIDVPEGLKDVHAAFLLAVQNGQEEMPLSGAQYCLLTDQFAFADNPLEERQVETVFVGYLLSLRSSRAPGS